MARRAFYSFHFKPDWSRAAQVRGMGVIDGNAPVSDNDWEKVWKGGNKAIERWIDDQLSGKSVSIVLIGAATAGRPWITHEICRTWDGGKAILGIHIHQLKDMDQKTSLRGANPFEYVKLGDRRLSSIVKVYDPYGFDSKGVYAAIQKGLPDWIETAIEIRKQYAGAAL